MHVIHHDRICMSILERHGHAYACIHAHLDERARVHCPGASHVARTRAPEPAGRPYMPNAPRTRPRPPASTYPQLPRTRVQRALSA